MNSTDQVASALYRMNGRDRYGRDLGDWDDPTSRIGRNEAERNHWRTQAQVLAGLGNEPPPDYAALAAPDGSETHEEAS